MLAKGLVDTIYIIPTKIDEMLKYVSIYLSQNTADESDL